MSRAVLLLGVLCAPMLSSLCAPVHGAEASLDDRVDAAIQKGVNFLLREIQGKGWFQGGNYPNGRIAIQVYALAKCDVSPRHPTLLEGLNRLGSIRFAGDPLDKRVDRDTYTVSIYLMGLDAAIEQLEVENVIGGDSASSGTGILRNRMRDATAWLLRIRARGRGGAWGYPALKNPGMDYWDNSNTQFAVLGLGVAAKREIPIPASVWQAVAEHFVKQQQKSGPEVKDRVVYEARPGRTGSENPFGTGSVRARGWGYHDKRPNVTMSMTCAGVSSLLLAWNHLEKAQKRDSDSSEGTLRSIRDGLGWLVKNFSLPEEREYYTLYSLEKVGDIGGIKRFGKHDWYVEGAKKLLSQQRGDGRWQVGNEDPNTVRVRTCFALLFLRRATDVLFSQRPLLVETGGGRADGDDADWAYLPSLKGRVHIPRFFQILQRSERSGAYRSADELIARALPGEKGRLANYVIPIFEGREGAGRRWAAKALEEITGLKSDDVEVYKSWARRWNRVHEIGEKRIQDEMGRLRRYLQERESIPLKRKVIWAVIRLGGREAIGELIDGLEGEDPEYRADAHRAVALLSGQSFPFDPKAPEGTRQKQVSVWKEWWAAEGGGAR